MNRDEASFIRAIWAAPADDAPRLVFADWLQDRGFDKRAAIQRNIVKMMGEAKGIWMRTFAGIGTKVLMLSRGAFWDIKEDGRLKMDKNRAPTAMIIDMINSFYIQLRIGGNYVKIR